MVNAFYTFYKHGGYVKARPNKSNFTFVEVVDLPIEGMIGSMFVMKQSTVAATSRLDKFRRSPADSTTMIAVDSVAYKIKIVPHLWDIALTMGIRMWPAR